MALYRLLIAAAALSGVTAAPVFIRSPSSGAGDLPKVDSEALQTSITEEALAQKAKELEQCAYSTPKRNRVFSSEGHNNTLDMIEKYLDRDYYTVERQAFQTLYSQREGGNFSTADKDFDTTVLLYSPHGDVTGPIVAVANNACNASDFPADVANGIALVPPTGEECTHGEQINLAAEAGAVGAVIRGDARLGAFPDDAELDEPMWDEEAKAVPTVGISYQDGMGLLTAVNAEEKVQGTLHVESYYENRTTYNIIAETKAGDKDNVLVIGAHSDSVLEGPGLNDNGSGMVGLLETAELLTNYITTNAVRFCFWSAEESSEAGTSGLQGSQHYLKTLSKDELMKIRLYLNFDMLAAPNFVYGIIDGDLSTDAMNRTATPGSDNAEAFLTEWFKNEGLNTKEADMFDGASDHLSFYSAGVPIGGIETGAGDKKSKKEAKLFGGKAGVDYDENYHSAKDDYSNLNFEAFLTNTKAIAAAVAHYGSSFEGVPERLTPTAEGDEIEFAL